MSNRKVRIRSRLKSNDSNRYSYLSKELTEIKNELDTLDKNN